MIETSSPTVWRRWLAFEIKRMRQQAGISQAAVAMAIGSQVPKVSLIESGQRNIQEKDLDKLLRLFEVPEHQWDDYFTAAKRAHEKGWWEHYDERTVPSWFVLYIGLEQGAERLRSYHPAIFPGLLQTPDYASAILQYFWTSRSQAAIEQLVEVRMRRQDALWREDKPVRMWAIVDEAALRRVVGSREIMRAQLNHVVEVVRRYDHVHLQIVPFDSPGTYEAAYGAFNILTFGWPTDPGVVYLEHPSNAEFLESIADSDEYSALFTRLHDLALSPDGSIEMLLLTARQY